MQYKFAGPQSILKHCKVWFPFSFLKLVETYLEIQQQGAILIKCLLFSLTFLFWETPSASLTCLYLAACSTLGLSHNTAGGTEVRNLAVTRAMWWGLEELHVEEPGSKQFAICSATLWPRFRDFGKRKVKSPQRRKKKKGGGWGGEKEIANSIATSWEFKLQSFAEQCVCTVI